MALKYEHSWLRRNIKAKDIRRALTDAYKAGLAGKEKPTEKIMERFLEIDFGPSTPS